MQEVYDRIRKRRVALGLSQDEVARRAGYNDRSSIAKIEQGKVDLPLTKLGLLADALDTTPKDLLLPAKAPHPQRR